jgi:hypothetical protein
MRRVYLETSVVSYLAARPSRDVVVAAHQQVTRAGGIGAPSSICLSPTPFSRKRAVVTEKRLSGG